MKHGFIRFVVHLRRLWWKVSRPQTLGVKIAVTVGSQKILLVRPSYERSWGLPGGAVSGQESPLEAAQRELLEELGFNARPYAMRLVGAYFSRLEAKADVILLFHLNLEHDIAMAPDGTEIQEARYFDTHALPTDTVPSVARRLDDLSNPGVYAQW